MNTSTASLEVLQPDAPDVKWLGLKTVWFQVGGTICNLRCTHCFISCSPENDKFAFMDRDTVDRFLAEATELGASEFYFTGGEPFANPQMGDILDSALRHGPSTVLTNATLFRPGTLTRLEQLRTQHASTLEIRVSLDGHNPEMNDPIRGEGTFLQAMDGVAKLVAVGFRPIITITRTWGCAEKDEEVLRGFRTRLNRIGYARPRLKILPVLNLGAEVERTGPYCDKAWITHEMMQEYDCENLQCSTSRLVTADGVWVCPILLDSTAARMGNTLRATMRDYPLRHQACHTCYHFGAICSNSTSDNKPCPK